MSHNTNEFDTAILLSGDSDFAALVTLVKEKGKKVIVISSRGHISKELIVCADKYIPFEKLKNIVRRIK